MLQMHSTLIVFALALALALFHGDPAVFVHGFAEVHVWPMDVRTFHHREIFEWAHLKFTVSGRSKQTSTDTHTRAQCSHASVGLAQARPNQNIVSPNLCCQ